MSNKAKVILLVVLAVVLIGLVAFVAVDQFGLLEGQPGSTAAPTEALTQAPTEVPTEAATEAPTEAPTEEPTEAPTEAPTEPPVLYYNPLNGEPMEEPLTKRIFCVTLNNTVDAPPHVGTETAEIIWEMYINDYATRCLAMFTDITKVEKMGSVRSVRYNFADIGLAYDAFVAHSGGSNQVLSYVKKCGIDHYNVGTSTSAGYSFYNKEIQRKGYAQYHSLCIRGAELYQKVADMGYRVTQDENKDYGLRFAEDGTPANGETANLVEIKFKLGSNSKLTTMTFDEETGKYVFSQYNNIVKNPAAGESFENVFVIMTQVDTITGGYHVADLSGSGEGYYACNGKIIPIQWHHELENEPFTFTLTDGTQLEQGVGNSYIAIVPLKSTVEWE